MEGRLWYGDGCGVRVMVVRVVVVVVAVVVGVDVCCWDVVVVCGGCGVCW